MWTKREDGSTVCWSKPARRADAFVVAIATAAFAIFVAGVAWMDVGSRLLSLPLSLVFTAVALSCAFRLLVGGYFRLTVGDDSLRWGWDQPKAKHQDFPLSEIQEVVLWYDDGWRLWLVQRSGKTISLPVFLESEPGDEIIAELRRRGVSVRRAKGVVLGRPN